MRMHCRHCAVLAPSVAFHGLRWRPLCRTLQPPVYDWEA
jgi:hypothetical protein